MTGEDFYCLEHTVPDRRSPDEDQGKIMRIEIQREWVVRCHLLAVLRENGRLEYSRLGDVLSSKLEFPEK